MRRAPKTLWMALAVFTASACGGVSSDDIDAGPDSIDAAGNTSRLTVVVTDDLGRVSSPGGEIDCPGTCEADLPNGSSLQLDVEPAVGSVFESWMGACSGSDPTCIVVLDGDRSVTADLSQLSVAQIRVFGDVVGGGGSGATNWIRSNADDEDLGAISGPSPDSLFNVSDFTWALTEPLAPGDYILLAGSEGSSPLTRTFVFLDADDDELARIPVMITGSNGSGEIVYSGTTDTSYTRLQFIGAEMIGLEFRP